MEKTLMQDEELARIILTALRDTPSPTHVLDMLEIARAQGVTEHYQAQRVARRLEELGYVKDFSASGEALLGSITERGIAALNSGEYQHLTEEAVFRLEGGGRTAEAKGGGVS